MNQISIIAKDKAAESDEVELTESFIVQQCQLHRGYRTPELNEKLYLHHLGFATLKNLDPYLGCKVLYVNNNAISDLSPLRSLVHLDSLYASNNAIRSLECLPVLPSLRLIDVSHNYLREFNGIAAAGSLETLLASHNDVHSLESLQGLILLSSLDVSYNKLTDLEQVDQHLSPIASSICTLVFSGNKMMQSCHNYRKKTIHVYPNLRFLDEYPVFPDERIKAEAFAEGGIEAEKKVTQKLLADKEAERTDQFEYFSDKREEMRNKRIPGAEVPTTQYFEDHKFDDVFIPL